MGKAQGLRLIRVMIGVLHIFSGTPHLVRIETVLPLQYMGEIGIALQKAPLTTLQQVKSLPLINAKMSQI